MLVVKYTLHENGPRQARWLARRLACIAPERWFGWRWARWLSDGLPASLQRMARGVPGVLHDGSFSDLTDGSAEARRLPDGCLYCFGGRSETRRRLARRLALDNSADGPRRARRLARRLVHIASDCQMALATTASRVG